MKASTRDRLDQQTIKVCVKKCEDIARGHEGELSSLAESVWGAGTARECAKALRELIHLEGK